MKLSQKDLFKNEFEEVLIPLNGAIQAVEIVKEKKNDQKDFIKNHIFLCSVKQ